LRLASNRDAASSFSSGDRLTGEPISSADLGYRRCASTSRCLPGSGGASGQHRLYLDEAGGQILRAHVPRPSLFAVFVDAYAVGGCG
jgi:hypothetical protein